MSHALKFLEHLLSWKGRKYFRFKMLYTFYNPIVLRVFLLSFNMNLVSGHHRPDDVKSFYI